VRRLCNALLVTALGAALIFVVAPPTSASSASAAGQPSKIVSLSPTATEMLFAIGAGDQVIAVDDQSSFPTDAPVTDLSGYTPNVEAIVGYDPDLVALPDGKIKNQLQDLGVDAVVLPVAGKLADSYAQIRKLGRITGNAEAANQLVAEMKADVADLRDEVPDGKRPTTYYELDDTYFSVDSTSFIGRLLKMGGFANIADEAKGDSGGYPQLSSEFIVDADPDVVFLADVKCCGQTPETFGARPGFDALTAVADGKVVALDDDIASRWGPRAVELLGQIVTERNQL